MPYICRKCGYAESNNIIGGHLVDGVCRFCAYLEKREEYELVELYASPPGTVKTLAEREYAIRERYHTLYITAHMLNMLWGSLRKG